MTTFRLHSFFLVMGFVFFISAPADAQWMTITRKIKSMHASQSDVATVILDARTFRVYQAIIDTLTADPKFQILRKDNAERFVEFTNKTSSVSLKVDSLANGLSQITVSAAHASGSAGQPTDLAVEAIFRVCNKMGIKCTLDKP